MCENLRKFKMMWNIQLSNNSLCIRNLFHAELDTTKENSPRCMGI